jgi:hypothetical protein
LPGENGLCRKRPESGGCDFDPKIAGMGNHDSKLALFACHGFQGCIGAIFANSHMGVAYPRAPRVMYHARDNEGWLREKRRGKKKEKKRKNHGAAKALQQMLLGSENRIRLTFRLEAQNCHRSKKSLGCNIRPI